MPLISFPKVLLWLHDVTISYRNNRAFFSKAPPRGRGLLLRGRRGHVTLGWTNRATLRAKCCKYTHVQRAPIGRTFGHFPFVIVFTIVLVTRTRLQMEVLSSSLCCLPFHFISYDMSKISMASKIAWEADRTPLCQCVCAPFVFWYNACINMGTSVER